MILDILSLKFLGVTGGVIYENSLFFGDALKSLGVTCHDICS